MREFQNGVGFGPIVDHALKGANDINVVIGPLSWRPTDGLSAKRWYFIICTSEEGRGFRCDEIIVPEADETYRTGIIAEFVKHRPLVLHDMDDELAMARLCEALWPGDRITNLRKAVERERGIA